jgi:hypothetical protein
MTKDCNALTQREQHLNVVWAADCVHLRVFVIFVHSFQHNALEQGTFSESVRASLNIIDQLMTSEKFYEQRGTSM